MGRARRVRDRVASLACVLTDEASVAALVGTGTSITTLIGMDEGRDSGDAAKEVFEAHDLSKHGRIRDAAINGIVSPRHATAIARGLDKLPSELTSEQVSKAEQAFIRRAPKNTPRRLTELADEVLAEVAPELVPETGDDDVVIEAQRRRARRKRSLVWGDDGDGSMWFWGQLPHLEASPLIAVVQAYVESDRRAERDRFKSTRATGASPRIIEERVRDDNQRTPDQRCADALTQADTPSLTNGPRTSGSSTSITTPASPYSLLPDEPNGSWSESHLSTIHPTLHSSMPSW